MKILMIHPHDIYSTTEPWTVRIREIAKELVHLGHKVKLVYFPLPLHQRGSIEPRISTLQTIPFSRRKYALPMVMLKVLQLAKWADVIHFQKCFSHASLPALFAGAVLHKPVHYDWDDDECAIYNFEPPSKLYGIYLKYLETGVVTLKL